MEKKYILLKEIPALRAGAIFEEDCDGGNQDFNCNAEGYMKFNGNPNFHASRDSIVNNPKWYKEVKPLWVTPEEEKKIKKILKKN